MTSRRLHITTFGCRANHYDSESVRAMATSQGYALTANAADADVVVFNSCAVTGEAERDLRRAVRRLARENPRARSVVMGCASALPHAGSLRELPSVSHVVAGADMAGVADALEIAPADGTTHQQSVRAVLRIQDGCDEHCTFCATTIARGRNRSRHVEDVVREAEQLAAWHPEIVLTGTHIGTWGADIGSTLGALVEALVQRVPDVRFRLSSIEATEVDAQLGELMTSPDGRVAPHLHAPLQSGSDRLLRRMGRHWYTARSYAAAIERLASRVSVLGLGADVIAGFPGESDADFAATVQLVEALPFTYLHVFPYSARPGTAAPRLPGALPASVIRERARRLREVGVAKAATYARSRAGGAADTIVVTAQPREGVTGDYLTLPVHGERGRGDRFIGTLAWGTESLEVV